MTIFPGLTRDYTLIVFKILNYNMKTPIFVIRKTILNFHVDSLEAFLKNIQFNLYLKIEALYKILPKLVPLSFGN